MTAPKTKTETEAKTEAKAPVSTASAGESTDPSVQYLLAVKQGHQMSRDALDPPVVVDEKRLEALDEQIADVDDKLADLGFPQESQGDRKKRLQKAADDAAKVEKDAEKRRADRAKAREDKAEAASR